MACTPPRTAATSRDRSVSKLKVKIGEKEVELEGDPEHVAKVIAALLSSTTNLIVSTSTGQADQSPPGGAPPVIVDIRSFFNEKQPTSDNEAAAAVAYYYKFVAPPEERRDTIDMHILEEGFRLANYPLPSRPAMTLVHAKTAGYLSQADKGSYRLTTVGHNLVAHSLGKGEGTSSSARRARA